MKESRWKKELRGLFFILVILAGIPGLLSAYFDIAAHKAGAEQPTAEKPIPNTQHARTKYISAAEAERIRLTWTIFLIAFPSAFLFGFVLRFAFKVDIFKQEPLPPRFERLLNDLKQKQL
jgi:hypothetical protein